MPVLEDDVLLFEAVEDDEMVEPVGAGKGGLADDVRAHFVSQTVITVISSDVTVIT